MQVYRIMRGERCACVVRSESARTALLEYARAKRPNVRAWLYQSGPNNPAIPSGQLGDTLNFEDGVTVTAHSVVTPSSRA